ncbi:MAG: tetratricopeptide repeat protein [Pyrinomonadaceae bacterium]
MDETKQIDAMKSLADVAKERSRPRRKTFIASVRVSPGAYLAVSSVLTFAAALLLRSERAGWALAAVLLAWAVIPVLAITDKIAFDGEFLIRRGVVPFVLRLFSGRSQKLSVSDFERVDTNAVRTLRRGGRVRYRYRSQIVGRGTGFVFASGGRSYREMVQRLFPLIHDDKIDLRTRELRDYLCDPKSLSREVQALQLASSVVLDNATSDFKLGGKKEVSDAEAEPAEIAASDVERAVMLRQLGNKLRIAGRLREAGEAFRRALNVLPRDAWLLYDFARLLRSQASAKGDASLLSRARAALRLSSMRADEDSSLLALIGEGFLECNEAGRAERSFQRAIDLEPRNFRARIGLADVALRNGKLAHVIHQYRDAAQAASEKALVIYARREADYYFRLNDDDDYLSAELSRINWLQTLTRVRRLAARVTNASILVALIGPFADPTVAGIGWALASSSLVAWLSSLFAIKFFSERRKPRPVE